MPKSILDVEIKEQGLRDLEQRINRIYGTTHKVNQEFQGAGKAQQVNARLLVGMSNTMSQQAQTISKISDDMTKIAKSAADTNKAWASIAQHTQKIQQNAGGGKAGGWGAAARGWGGAMGNAALGMMGGVPFLGAMTQGAATGATIGMAAGPWGAVVGALGGAILGFIKDAAKTGKDVGMTLMGHGDFMGLATLTAKSAEERRYLMGLPAFQGYGSMRAFNAIYGRVADPGAMLDAVGEARTDPTSGAFQTYLQLGVDPYTADSAAGAKNMLERVRMLARNTPESMLGPALYQQYNLRAAGLSMADVRRARNLPETEWRTFADEWSKKADQLDIEDNRMKNMQDLNTQIAITAKALETGIVKTIGDHLVPKLTDMSAGLANLVAPGSGMLAQFATALGDAVGWINQNIPGMQGQGVTTSPNAGTTGPITPSLAGGPVNAIAGQYGALPWDKQNDYDALRKGGLSHEQALGVMGNIMAESGGLWDIAQRGTPGTGGAGGGWGLAQWTDMGRRNKFKELYGHDIMKSTRKEQLDYLIWEIKNRPEFQGLLQTHTVDEATRFALNRIEAPLDQSEAEARKRIGMAMGININLKVETIPGTQVTQQSSSVAR